MKTGQNDQDGIVSSPNLSLISLEARRERAAVILAQISRGEMLHEPCAVVVAHPDDEVLGLSSTLMLLSRATLIHATFPAAESVAQGMAPEGRFLELDAALAHLPFSPYRRVRYDLPDGQVVGHLAQFVDRLVHDLKGSAFVVTHAFEGGHPDHDSCAVAVREACRRLGGRAPIHLEFPVYCLVDGMVTVNQFASKAGSIMLELDTSRQAGKRAALNAFVSQAHVVERFPVGREMLREAESIDVEQIRNARSLLFARGDSSIEVAWREKALQQLALF